MKPIISISIKILILCTSVLFSACAGKQTLQSESDSLEKFNREVYALNEQTDRLILKPLAKVYQQIAPAPARQGVRNFFNNLEDPLNALNGLLQGKPGSAAKSMGRFLINSTSGLFGLLDVATPMGIQQQNEDFGQTLAVWGVPSGPYLVLPFFGPTTVRDSGSVITGLFYDPLGNLNSPQRDYTKALDIISIRAGFLGLSEMLDAQPDGYSFVRDFYQQQRNNLIFDGDLPENPHKENSNDLIDQLLDNQKQ